MTLACGGRVNSMPSWTGVFNTYPNHLIHIRIGERVDHREWDPPGRRRHCRVPRLARSLHDRSAPVSRGMWRGETFVSSSSHCEACDGPEPIGLGLGDDRACEGLLETRECGLCELSDRSVPSALHGRNRYRSFVPYEISVRSPRADRVERKGARCMYTLWILACWCTFGGRVP